MKKEYGYMIKSVDISKDKKYGLGLRGFKYPLKKGAKVIALDWNKEKICKGGIFGLIHETKNHYIIDRELWMILKYTKGKEVIVDDSKIKVPYAWIVDWGNAAKIQQIYKDLTGKDYCYNYSFQKNSDGSVQKAGDISVQTAGYASTQTAGDGSISIIRGKVGFCKHIGNGNVLQVLCFCDFVKNNYIFLTKIINDNKKHKLEAIKENNNWILRDTIIEEEK